MNIKYKIIIGIMVALVAGYLLTWGGGNDVKIENVEDDVVVLGEDIESSIIETSFEEYVVDESDMINAQSLFVEGEIEESSLAEEEIVGLIQMREEEKLARDVYAQLYDKWGLNIFTNISSSEETHTNTVKYLLDKYEIDDPVLDDTRGMFTSEVYSELYKSLVEKGETSLVDALIVGATIEDLDIFDLEELLLETQNNDIKLAYENLVKGSRNHMRAFVRLLEREGGVYKAQYLSQEEIDGIIAGEQEQGRI